MSALPSSKKTHSERHKQILKQLLKEPANKTCVDCKTATHPRWASWNLGCFICIRCSGIHRLMGTHISRVKSVDLDAWTDEQVELMVKWGNAKCNSYWEAKLPANYVPDGLKIENFIRTKYDLKKWAASAHVPDPLLIKSAPGGASSAGLPEIPSAKANSATPGPKTAGVGLLAPARNAKASATRQAPAASLLDDDFGTFTSSPLPTPTPAPQTTQQQNTGGSSHSGGPARVLNERKDLKKSILSLYSLPSSSLTSFDNSQQSYNYGGAYAAPKAASPAQRVGAVSSGGRQSGDVASMSDSLMGLSFSSQSTQPAPKAGETRQNQWKNEWNDSSSSVNNWGSSVGNSSSSVGSPLNGTFRGQTNSTSNYTTAARSNPLDDDLFKNVWS